MALITRRQFSKGAIVGALVAGAGFPASAQVDDGTWSTHPMWLILKKSRLTTDDRGRVHAAIAPEVMSLVGKPLLISGFILPIEASTSYSHFILSRYSPECPFCPAGAPNEVIEVFSKKPMSANSYLAFLEGTFHVQNDVDRGLFYRLDGAGTA